MSPDERYERARTALPGVDIPRETFASWIENRPEGEHDEDVYLACACAIGDVRALATFDQRYSDELASLHRRFGYLPGDADDFRQRLYERLFTGEAPKIRDYMGRSALRTWLRVSLTRLLLNAATREAREYPAEDEIFLALRDPADPETDAIRKAHGETLRAAFAEAVSRLGARDRNMLRYAFVDGLGIEALAKVQGVHRATASRWLGDARDHFAVELESALRERLPLSDRDFASVLRSMLAQVDVTLLDLLGKRP